jgi:hypothetical protein
MYVTVEEDVEGRPVSLLCVTSICISILMAENGKCMQILLHDLSRTILSAVFC